MLGDNKTVAPEEVLVWFKERLDSGRYESEADVLEAASLALRNEEREFDDMLRTKVQEAYDDPRPSIPARDVFDRLKMKHLSRTEIGKVGS